MKNKDDIEIEVSLYAEQPSFSLTLIASWAKWSNLQGQYTMDFKPLTIDLETRTKLQAFKDVDAVTKAAELKFTKPHEVQVIKGFVKEAEITKMDNIPMVTLVF